MIGDGGYGQVYEADAISEGKMRTQNDLRSSWSDVQDQQTSRPECSKQQRRNQVNKFTHTIQQNISITNRISINDLQSLKYLNFFQLAPTIIVPSTTTIAITRSTTTAISRRSTTAV
uniref:Protein kinase domain-containing protein n=1 Tax=Meloidogyne incognita TaxID=6306 RepID=A0A914MWI7_MELIC